MTKTILALLFMLSSIHTQAQLLKKLGDKAAKAAERTVERKVEKKAEKETEKAFDSVFNNKKLTKKKGKKRKSKNESDTNNDQEYEVSTSSEFTSGNQIIFEDNYSREKVGDFPSKWDTNGSGEVVLINNEKWFRIANKSMYIPLTKGKLPENYTIEFDMLTKGVDNGTSSQAFLVLLFADHNGFQNSRTWSMVEISPCQFITSPGAIEKQVNGSRQLRNEIGKDYREAINGKSRISISANKTRLRVWINDNKIVDVPRLLDDGIAHFKMYTRGLRDERNVDEIFIRDFKMAKTGIDYRSKLLNEGSISTNAILFESGSSTIKNESFAIIRDISNVLLEDTSINIRIVGHTDADGSEDGNLKLSKNRAAAVKQLMTSQFKINESRIEVTGKGESEPISDNTTPEGKAQNRRVEFIKI